MPEPVPARAAVLAVDGGNSKADLALVGLDGTLLAAVHGPTISHQAVGIDRAMANLRDSAAEAVRSQRAEPARSQRAEVADRPAAPDGDRPVARLGVYALAGADYPSDVRLLRRSIERLGLTDEVVILNDTFGALRAGTTRPWGVVLICGRGINGAAIAPNGRTARFDAVGLYSGDWGGGLALGFEANAAAVRARDGRGRPTSLERLVPEHFGLRSPVALTRALYLERIAEGRLAELAPIVFEAAAAGDSVARSIVDHLADELITMATALLGRLRMRRLDLEVVLAGGVFQATDRAFYERIEAGIQAAAPAARIVRLAAPPVLGPALIGLDRLSATGTADPSAAERLRGSLEAWASERGASGAASGAGSVTGAPEATRAG